MPRVAHWVAPLRRVAPLAAVLVVGAAAVAVHAAAQSPGLPRGFRAWTHVKSMVVTDPDRGMYGFHNVYANPAALEGLRARGKGRRFKAGATFVVSIYEVEKRDSVIAAGPKRRDVVQVKDPAATATGGWTFAAFDPAGQAIAVDAKECVTCHATAKDNDFVFATFTD
jgi:hypothetical protein